MELLARQSVFGTRPVLALSGEIDLATIPLLHSAVARFTADHRGAAVVLDVDGINACDDAGLGVILGAAGRLREAGGELVVVCSGGPLRNRLARTGFDRAVAVHDSISAAVATPRG